MEPNKLSDANLESILWNKVPYAMQQEIEEMKERTLKELFQRPLKVESWVLEKEKLSASYEQCELTRGSKKGYLKETRQQLC